MNEDRNQDRHPAPQARQKHPDEWMRDLNPDHLAGQNIGLGAETRDEPHRTAFHLRKAGRDFPQLADAELKRIPIVAAGERLQQGATYVDLTENPPREFTATAQMSADATHAYAPKDRVPYEVWNRLIGEPKPGQE
jgi:hypothetical protein